MENEKTIEVLNILVEINNDRTEGYETALRETEESELKALFAEFARTSEKCKNELSDEIFKLGGTPTASTKITGKFFRIWMDVKAAITGKDRKGILNSCEYGEDRALGIYREVIETYSTALSSDLHSMISNQKRRIASDHDRVKAMRDACEKVA